jgi:hypothetical protein
LYLNCGRFNSIRITPDGAKRSHCSRERKRLTPSGRD